MCVRVMGDKRGTRAAQSLWDSNTSVCKCPLRSSGICTHNTNPHNHTHTTTHTRTRAHTHTHSLFQLKSGLRAGSVKLSELSQWLQSLNQRLNTTLLSISHTISQHTPRSVCACVCESVCVCVCVWF